MHSEVIINNEFGQVQKSIFSDTSSLTQTSGLSVTHDLCNATISLYGGHVLSWQPIKQKPVLWMSEASLYGNGKGIRGGVPICFPWFGPFNEEVFDHTKKGALSLEEKSELVNHGFARTSTWDIESIDVLAENVKIILILKGENKSPAWKIPFEVKQEIILGESFSQNLFITNKSPKAIEYTGALHSYFAVSSPENTEIQQLSDVKFYDKLTDENNKIKPLNNCKGPIDRVYYNNETMNIIDKGWNRKLTISTTDSNQWVLWNPGKETAENMADIHTSGENEYVCLEAANTSPVLITANATVVLGQLITISNIA